MRIVNRTLGIVTCPSYHDHGEVKVTLRFTDDMPLAFKLRVYDADGHHTFELPRRLDSGDLLSDWLRVAEPGMNVFLGGAKMRIRRSNTQAVLFQLPVNDDKFSAMLIIGRAKLFGFLVGTEAIVPPSTEVDALKLDACIARLLRTR